MTAALCLALALTMSAGAVEPVTSHGSGASTCSGYTWRTPPDTIRVLRIHHKGSSVPKRVETWPSMDRYVAAVMASGAWPNRVWESAKVGAIVIRQYATWMAIHTHRSYRGKCYAISDSEQYLRAGARPGSHLPVRTLRAVRLMQGVSLTKHGRHFRTGWSGGEQYDHWHLGEDAVRRAAEHGAGWRSIIHRFLSPVVIHGDWR